MSRSGVKTRLLASLSVVWLAGCPPQTETSPIITIAPGAEARWCAFAHQCGKNSKRADARVVEGEKRAEQPQAQVNANGASLANDELMIALAACPPGGTAATTSERCGDLRELRGRREYKSPLRSIETFIDGQRVEYTRIESRSLSPDGAVLVLIGAFREHTVRTQLALNASNRGVLVSHEYGGTLSSLRVHVGFREHTQSYAPSQALGFSANVTTSVLGAIDEHASVGFAATEGDLHVAAQDGGADLLVESKPTAGGGIHAEWVMMVGRRADTTSVLAEAIRAAGGVLGELAITGAEAWPIGTKFVIANVQGVNIGSLVAPAASTEVKLELPPGRYAIRRATDEYVHHADIIEGELAELHW